MLTTAIQDSGLGRGKSNVSSRCVLAIWDGSILKWQNNEGSPGVLGSMHVHAICGKHRAFGDRDTDFFNLECVMFFRYR